MYHRFSPEGETHARRLPHEDLIWQMKHLNKHHESWTPDDQLLAPASHKPPVVITIDDGYADFGEVAFPVLKKYGLLSTVFLTTGFVAGRTWFWWDRLHWLLSNCGKNAFSIDYDGQHLECVIESEQQIWAAWSIIADHLSVIDDDRKEAALNQIAATLATSIPFEPPREYLPLNWDQVRSLANQGVHFGAHTIDHPVLSRVDSSRAEHEIVGSRLELAQELGGDVNWFCYPQGGRCDFTQGVVELVRQAGYKGCYTAFADAHHNGDHMTLPRYSVSSDRVGFLWIMCGAEHLFMRKNRTVENSS